MSSVTSLLLHIPILEDEGTRIKEVNAFFNPISHGRGFVSIEDETLPEGWYGGSKHLQCNLYVGAFNWLNLDKLIEHLRTVQWEDPENVQLLIKDEHEEHFRIIDVCSKESYNPEEIREQHRLLGEAQFLLEEASKGDLTQTEIDDWQRKYKALFKRRDEVEGTLSEA